MPGFSPVGRRPVGTIGGPFVGLSVAIDFNFTAIQGAAYTGLKFSAFGGTGPYTFALITGTLPSALSLSTSGDVTGVAASSGVTSGLVVRTTDSLGATGDSAAFSITVDPAGLTRRSLQSQRMRAFWHNPNRTKGKPGVTPRPKRAQYRRPRRLEEPSRYLQVCKLQSYTILSPPPDAVSTFKLISYVILDSPRAPPSPGPSLRRKLKHHWRAHERSKKWLWSTKQLDRRTAPQPPTLVRLNYIAREVIAADDPTAAGVRLASLPREVLLAENPPTRLESLDREVLQSENAPIRAAQVVREVLVSLVTSDRRSKLLFAEW